MISFPRFNFVYIAIPKTATSSMRSRLFRLGTADRRSQSHPLIAYPHPQHYNIHEYRQILGDELDSRFKFTFVRNPWDRLVSHYTKECSNWRNRSMSRSQILNPEGFQKWAAYALSPTKRRSPNRRFPHNPHHHQRMIIESQFNFIAENGKPTVDFIGRYENVDEDFEKVLVRINDISLLPRGKYWVLPKRNVSRVADKHYSYYYNDKTIENVRKVYAKDIEYFGYTYERAS